MVVLLSDVLRMQIHEDVFSKVTSQEKVSFDGLKVTVKKISRSSSPYVKVQILSSYIL